MWAGRRVLLGVTGGIAAYKSVLLARELTRRGAVVDVVLSRGAQKFVGAVTFEAVTRRRVHQSLWEPDSALTHIALASEASVVIVAPATAQLLARAAAGMADDLLTAVLLATEAPVVCAPAMNDAMYANAATTANIARLEQRGWRMSGPGIGDLAEGPSQLPGRMLESNDILDVAERVLAQRAPWNGWHVVVTAGPTREPIDPVRVITNRSTGKMGFRIARAAWLRGARVTLITGPSAQIIPDGIERIDVETTAEMSVALRHVLPSANVLIMAAAPADYRVAVPSSDKLPRADGARSIEVVGTDDILLDTIDVRPAAATVVGFALEHGDAVARGKRKLERKRLDMVVINDVTQPGAGPAVDTNAVTIVDRRGGSQQVPLQDKSLVAERILDAIEHYRA